MIRNMTGTTETRSTSNSSNMGASRDGGPLGGWEIARRLARGATIARGEPIAAWIY